MGKLEELFEVCKKHGVDFSYNAFTKGFEVRKFLMDATGKFIPVYDKVVFLSETSDKPDDEFLEELTRFLIRFIEEKENSEEEKEE